MKQIIFFKCLKIAIVILFAASIFSCTQNKTDESRVKDVMDKVVTKLYQTKTQDELSQIDYNQAMALFSEEDIEVLARRANVKNFIFICL